MSAPASSLSRLISYHQNAFLYGFDDLVKMKMVMGRNGNHTNPRTYQGMVRMRGNSQSRVPPAGQPFGGSKSHKSTTSHQGCFKNY